MDRSDGSIDQLLPLVSFVSGLPPLLLLRGFPLSAKKIGRGWLTFAGAGSRRGVVLRATLKK